MESHQLPPVQELFVDEAVPTARSCEFLDARELPPPEPLKETLEGATELDGGVLIQLNDRVPQHLYPRLADRGLEYQTVNHDAVVVTAIWEK